MPMAGDFFNLCTNAFLVDGKRDPGDPEDYRYDHHHHRGGQQGYCGYLR